MTVQYTVQDLNPWPADHESPPIATRPELPANQGRLLRTAQLEKSLIFRTATVCLSRMRQMQLV